MHPSVDSFTKYFAALAGKRVALLGLGVSNRPLLPLLAKAGAVVSVRDQKDFQTDGEIWQWREKGVSFLSGDGHLDNLDEEIILRSPGILPTHPSLLKATANGSTITSEIELFFALCPCQTIGITGSNGKTTTSALTAALLRQAGFDVFLGGNIGEPLLPKIPQMQTSSIAIAELSSFQLMGMQTSPMRAVITNISPNHLDKHADMAEYVAAKEAIFAFQKPTDLLVLNAGDEYTKTFLQKAPGETLLFSDERPLSHGIYAQNGAVFVGNVLFLEEKSMLLPGRHNVQNLMAALGATIGLVSAKDARRVAETFPGVEHRLEFIREIKGVSYYNSSIDSSPSRTVAALSCFDRPVILLAGGYDKQIPFEPMTDALIQKVRRLILSGPTADKIEAALRSNPRFSQGKPEIIRAETLEKAVNLAAESANVGDVVLLSPACASFDAFENFEHRGKAFKEAVFRLV